MALSRKGGTTAEWQAIFLRKIGPRAARPGNPAGGVNSRPADGPGCQQPRRGAFLRASLTAYNPKGDTLIRSVPCCSMDSQLRIRRCHFKEWRSPAVAAP